MKKLDWKRIGFHLGIVIVTSGGIALAKDAEVMMKLRNFGLSVVLSSFALIIIYSLMGWSRKLFYHNGEEEK